MVHYETRDRVAVVTLDRPEARNAIDPATAAAIEEAIDRFEADDELWVGILAARGPVFSAGADLKAVSSGQADGIMTRRGGFGGFCRRARTKPVIAAVDGPALAGGCEIVAACDLVVASTSSSFGIPEVKRSLVAGAGGLFRLGRKLPPNLAMELALTGDPITAEQAYVHGLVNQLVEPGAVLDAALALAGRIIANAPVAVRLSRQVLLDSEGLGDDDAWRVTGVAYRAVQETEDFREGPLAFVEKRPPRWTGR
jgi:enoyl-CoA hydratase